MIERNLPAVEKKASLTIFSIVAGMAFCLLVGCGGSGGGSATSSRAPDPIAALEPGDPVDPDNVEPVFNPFPARELYNPDPEKLPPWNGLLNEVKFDLIKAQSAWESGYTGKGVVVGIMEQVNQFHDLFDSADNGKIHPKSILTSPYPDGLPVPPEKYITDQFTKHPEFTCHLQFENVNYCPDTSGDQKYFLRDENGGIHVLPGLIDFNPQCSDEQRNNPWLGDYCEQHDKAYDPVNPLCPVFIREEEEEERIICSIFGTNHGTSVAGIAAASKGTVVVNINGYREGTWQDILYRANYQGVAYDSQILIYSGNLKTALPASPQNFADYYRNAPKEADVYNYSSAFVASFDPETPDGPNGKFYSYGNPDGKPRFPDETEEIFTIFAEAIKDMNQPMIAATGNEWEAFPLAPAIFPYFFPDLRGKILAVTAIEDDGEYAWFSNKCGPLPDDWNPQEHGRHYCLAAPGDDDFFDDVGFRLLSFGNREAHRAEGTSFAAPYVTGAFAILKEKFRNKDGTDGMSDKELIVRLVNTAYNEDCRDWFKYYENLSPDGKKRWRESPRNSSCDELLPKRSSIYSSYPDYSNMSIYGAGLLDIKAAIAPVGIMKMSMSGDIKEGITYDFGTTSLSTSTAFGDALQQAFQTREVVAFDELNAPFWYPLSSLTSTISTRKSLRERHAGLFKYENPPVETAIGGRVALKSSHMGSSEQIDMSLRQPVDISNAQMELLLTVGDLSTASIGLHEDESFAHPYLNFAGEGIGLGGSLQLGTGELSVMGFTSGSANVSRDVPIDAHGGLLEYTLEPLAGVEVGMQAGAIIEESRALGLLSEGGFGELGESSTAFAGVSLDGELEDNWHFRASMLFGRTNLDEPSIGLLKTSTTLTSSAFRFALEGNDIFMDADRMDVFVAQPLRIENGKADFTIPVGRTPSGLVRREQVNGVSLEPRGRELEFGMRYEMQVSEDITAAGGLGIVHEGGHSKHTATEVYGLANLRFQF